MKILILLSLLLFSGYAKASQPGPNTYPAIAYVISERIDDPKKSAAGTVTIVKHNDEIKYLTNAHVIEKGGYYRYVKFKDGTIRNFRVVKSDREKDLALLKLDYPVETQSFKLREEKLTNGEKVWCCGFGWNRYQAEPGKIIQLKHTKFSFLTDIDSISGTSGGPCIDKDGWLIGVRNASGFGPNMSQTNVIDLDTVKQFLEE